MKHLQRRRLIETATRLETFIQGQDLRPNVIADVSGVSRQHLLRIRHGTAEPTRPMMIWITIAVRRLVKERHRGRRVRLTELFDLGDVER